MTLLVLTPIVFTLLSPIACVLISVIFIYRNLKWDDKIKLTDLWSEKPLIKATLVILSVLTLVLTVVIQLIERAQYNRIIEAYEEEVSNYQPSITFEAPNFQEPFGQLILVNTILVLFSIVVVSLLIKYKYASDANDTFLERIEKAMRNEKGAQPLKTLDCVFTVSAIAIQNNKFLLVKRNYNSGTSKWIQPGSYYRTNKVFESGTDEYDNFGTVLPPYDYLVHQLVREAYICDEDQFEILDFSASGIIKTTNTSFLSPGLQISTAKNKVSPAPFLIQFEEENKLKSSGKRIHIDLFYAIELKDNYSLAQAKSLANQQQVKYLDIDLFSIDDIRAMAVDLNNIYPDLFVICNKFLECYRKDKFANSQIRTCTFNNNKQILLIRLGDCCNHSCYFCIRSPQGVVTKTSQSLPDGLDTIIDDALNLNFICKKKLIFSGGEPLIYESIIEKIIYIVSQNAAKISEIAICTNGHLWEKFAQKTRTLKQICDTNNILIKFVIGISWYNVESFKEITAQGDDVEDVYKFITFLNDNSILFDVNLVMTKTFLNNIKEYVAFWNEHNLRRISLSFGCKSTGIHIKRLLSKEECISCYKQLISGHYQIEQLDKLELMLPDCDNLNCQQGQNLNCIYYNSDKSRWEILGGCIEKSI